jgi:hypothetical protein
MLRDADWEQPAPRFAPAPVATTRGRLALRTCSAKAHRILHHPVHMLQMLGLAFIRMSALPVLKPGLLCVWLALKVS